jgi:hypothetical protein
MTRIERASPEWRSGALPTELHPHGARPAGLEPASSAVAEQCSSPLSYGRLQRSLRQESNPHLGLTTGACLPLTLRRLEMQWRRTESNRHLPRCKRGALPKIELHPQGKGADGWSRTTTARRQQGYSPLSSPMLGVRVEGRPTGFEPVPRGSRPRMLPLHHSHHVSGDDRTRTGGLSRDKRALLPLSYAPDE